VESSFQLPGIRGLKFALPAGLTLLTAETLFAQSAGQSDLDALKARMDQMQKQYEQRIDKMDQERKQDHQKNCSTPILTAKPAVGSQDLDLRLQKDGTDLFTPNMPSCYDLHGKDSTKTGI
jgi:hypothetical protein